MGHIATPGGTRLEFETYGSAADPALLMIMGFGAQLIAWPAQFCEVLAAGGRYVIAFDNRDCGLSTKFDAHDVEVQSVLEAVAAGDPQRARSLVPYTLSDMARDGVDLLDALGVGAAHVVGASMGGMIAQTMAIEHAQRLLSLTSIMSTTGEPEYGQAAPEALQALLTASPSDRAGYVEASVRSVIWRSKRWPELDKVRRLAGESFDRGYHPQGTTRQLAAMIASGSRADALRKVTVPTLVIHGLDDTLVAPSGGERTAELIPGAGLMLVPDMGHDRPEPLWPLLSDAILGHTAGR